jgi:hypothetical protein
MAGSPTWGKISTGIRLNANSAQSATATKATTTVIGRDRAARTRRIFCFLGFCSLIRSLHSLQQKWLNVACSRGDPEKPTPYAEAGQNVVNFSLGQKPLGFR